MLFLQATMPVIMVKNATFEENETHVYVSVPLKGVSRRKVAIFVTDSYLKAS